jgi:hypothetical protein
MVESKGDKRPYFKVVDTITWKPNGDDPFF